METHRGIIEEKKYSWLSYISVGLGMFILFLFLLFFTDVTGYSKTVRDLVRISFFVLLPINLCLSIAVLFKRSEKKLLGIIGLLLTVMSAGVFALLFLIALNFAP